MEIFSQQLRQLIICVSFNHKGVNKKHATELNWILSIADHSGGDNLVLGQSSVRSTEKRRAGKTNVNILLLVWTELMF